LWYRGSRVQIPRFTQGNSSMVEQLVYTEKDVSSSLTSPKGKKGTVAEKVMRQIVTLFGRNPSHWFESSPAQRRKIPRNKVGERRNRGAQRGGQGETFAGGRRRRERERKKGIRVYGRGKKRRGEACWAMGRSSRTKGQRREKKSMNRRERRRRKYHGGKRGEKRKKKERRQVKKEKGLVRRVRKKKGRPVRGQRTKTNGKTARRRNGKK
jgi:hypothetical protein